MAGNSCYLEWHAEQIKFVVHHPDPTIPGVWVDKTFYASNFKMAAQTLEDGEEVWTDLSINIRRIEPI